MIFHQQIVNIFQMVGYKMKCCVNSYLLAIVGYTDLSLSNTQDILDGHCQSKLMRGIRHLRHFNPYDLDQEDQTYLLSDPNWLAGLKLLEKFNLSFQHHFLPHQMAVGAEVAAKFPKIKFMIDHCGLPNNKNETSISDWKEGK